MKKRSIVLILTVILLCNYLLYAARPIFKVSFLLTRAQQIVKLPINIIDKTRYKVQAKSLTSLNSYRKFLIERYTDEIKITVLDKNNYVVTNEIILLTIFDNNK